MSYEETANKKITLFLPTLAIGGAQRVVINLATEFDKQGCEVDILLTDKRGQLLKKVPETVNIVDFDTKLRWAVTPLARYLANAEPDAVISIMTGPNIILLIANLISGSQTQCIISEHNTQSMKGNPAVKRDLLLGQLLYRFADRIVAVSRGVADDVAEWAKIPRDQIDVIHNPVVTESQLSGEYSVPDHPWLQDPSVSVVISAGRHVEQKDFETLLRSVELVRERRDVKLILLGEGDQTEDLKSLVNKLGIEDHVSLPGFVDNFYGYLAYSDAFVLSSVWEGFGNVLVEAMGCGTPVVSTDCPYGPAEILDDGEYGPLVPVKRPDLLSNAIVDVLDDPTETSNLINRASDFSSKPISAEYLRLLDD